MKLMLQLFSCATTIPSIISNFLLSKEGRGEQPLSQRLSDYRPTIKRIARPDAIPPCTPPDQTISSPADIVPPSKRKPCYLRSEWFDAPRQYDSRSVSLPHWWQQLPLCERVNVGFAVVEEEDSSPK